MEAFPAIRPAAVDAGQKVFGLAESQATPRVKAIALAVDPADSELFSVYIGRVGMA